ncbi:outer membrane beta-barrel protein [Cyclobacterium qasimii]|uniref:N-acetylmuramoyl-L-alanine amidase n=2 Tax=Cyclobacterium qasimii TaxID=1350429 RepID=S7WFY2_9BACT|nr:outer membrane beta-barrel protein [Cyclobacterium qasimii]EPR65659.1 N-acetylmuramoyl-L-alanine amidase [Cyclobacterium qasimii M12-11B]GEO20174.1 hypothetical protein CQA01_07080 [Cyclobacterium qasimii]
MRFIFVFVFFTLIFNEAVSQEKYLPGYVKTLDGEIVPGLIDYRNWDNNPKNVFFKQEQQGIAEVYKALDIAEFGVLDEIYVGAVVEKEVTTNTVYVHSESSALQVRMDTVFLQTLVGGEKSLLGMKSSGKQNFYIKEGNNYTLLKYKWFLVEQNGTQLKDENLTYKRQLASYLGNCLHMIAPLEGASYDSKSLENIFLKYYECTGGVPAFRKVREKVIVELGIVTGASSTSLSFYQTEGFEDLLSFNFPSTYDLVAGVFLDVLLPRNERKWSIYNELLYTSYTVSGSFQDITNENDYRNVEGKLGFGYLKVNNMLRYRYQLDNFKVFVNGGISNGFALSETNKKSTFRKFYTSETNDDGKILKETRSYEQGVIIGLGATKGRLTGEFRYERGNGMSAYTAFGVRVERYFLLLNYRLN